jgi:arginine deiminase
MGLGVTNPAKYSGHGGVGWVPRLGSLREDRELVWSAFGVASECGKLRSVLLHRPGREIEAITDAASVLWIDALCAERAQEQHDALAALYRSYGVVVNYVEDVAGAKPNLYFMKDTFAMTPEGAILSRPASSVRAGEERVVARALSQLGVPIILSVHGSGTFEGADLMIVNDDLALIGQGLRTNEAGARQAEHLLRGIGFGEVARVQLNDDCMHLDCGLSIVDRDLALIHASQMSFPLRDTLKRHGFRIVEVPDMSETTMGLSMNVVALEPGLVTMPAHRPLTKALLEEAGVTCLEVDVSELMKGGGAVHCLTGVIQRDGV